MKTSVSLCVSVRVVYTLYCTVSYIAHTRQTGNKQKQGVDTLLSLRPISYVDFSVIP